MYKNGSAWSDVRLQLNDIRLDLLVEARVPSVLNLLHSCDNRKCVNPNHLREGTQQDNVNDAISRGRHAYGETNGRSKLNVAKVRAIREQYARGGVTHRGLAHQFHVSHGAIGRILRKVDWRHVN
jgi:hypothetical protein